MYQCPINLGGNSCGHDPLTPDFRLKKLIKKGKGGIPRVITLAVERLMKYYESPSLLPSLNFANESFRQQRSERREACITLLACLLHHVDLTSLRVGVPTKDGFFNMSLEHLFAETYLSKSRAERAFSDLKAAGIITCTQARLQTEDGWVSANAVKCISANLFGALGLYKMLMIERKKASKRLRARFEIEDMKANRSGQGRQALYLSAIARRLQRENSTKGKAIGSSTKAYGALTQDQKKAYQHRLMQLKAAQPGTPTETLRSLALASI